MSKTLRFGVGSDSGPRSSTWTLKANRNDVYLMRRRSGGDIKVSFHENGPWRFALTSEHLKKPSRLQAPAGTDPRLAKEWPRPTPIAAGLTRAFGIVVPWFEVISRPDTEDGNVVWADAPPRGSSVEFDIFFASPTANINGHPGVHSMGTRAIGDFVLPNGDRVFVVWWTPQITDAIQLELDRVYSAEVLQDGEPVAGLGMLTFGIEDGVGVHIDVTLPNVVELSRAVLLSADARCPRCGATLGTPDERARMIGPLSSATAAGVPVRHLKCGQYFRARLKD